MKNQKELADELQRLQREIMEIESRHIVYNPNLARFSLSDIFDPANMDISNRLFTKTEPRVTEEIALLVGAPDLFIQKLRALYLTVLMFSHNGPKTYGSRKAFQKTQEVKGTAQILKGVLYKMLKCFYLELHRGTAATKYMAEFLQMIDIKLYGPQKANQVIPELLNKYPKMDEYFIDVFMFKINGAQKDRPTIDDNFLLSGLLWREFDLDCRFVTDRELVLEDLRIQLSRSSVCILPDRGDPLCFEGGHPELMDISKVGSFSSSVFDKMDQSYIRDLSGMGSVTESRINEEPDLTKISVYSSYHFSQLMEPEEVEELPTRRPLRMLTMKKRSTIQEKMEMSLEVREVTEIDEVRVFDDQSELDIQVNEEEHSPILFNNLIESEKNGFLLPTEQGDNSPRSSARLHNSKARESHGERETTEGDLHEYPRDSQKYEFKTLRKEPIRKPQQLLSPEQTQERPCIRKTLSESKLKIPEIKSLQLPSLFVPGTATQRPAITKFECKIKTNLKVRGRLGSDDAPMSALIQRKQEPNSILIQQRNEPNSACIRPLQEYQFITIRR